MEILILIWFFKAIYRLIIVLLSNKLMKNERQSVRQELPGAPSTLQLADPGSERAPWGLPAHRGHSKDS